MIIRLTHCARKAFGIVVLTALAAGCSESSSSGQSSDAEIPDGFTFNAPAEFQAVIDPTSSLCAAGTAGSNVSAELPPVGHKIDLNFGARLVVETVDGPADTVLALYGPEDAGGLYGSGLPLLWDDNGGAGAYSKIEWTATATGSFLVVVGAKSGSGLVTLELTVDGATGCAEVITECKTDADCDDANPCSIDRCLPSLSGGNTCGSVPDPCDDGDPCTTDSCGVASGCQNDLNDDIACDAVECVDAADCDDGDSCTEDSCSDDKCLNLPLTTPECDPAQCDDGDPCTADSVVNGRCSNTPIAGCRVGDCETDEDCDDGNACTVNTCVEGQCAVSALECVDEDPCTLDACSPDNGCVFSPTAGPGCDAECGVNADCEDGDDCTVDTCVGGQCQQTASTAPRCNANECDDDDPCTVDEAVAGGCKHTQILDCSSVECDVDADCDDEVLCTVDKCGDDGYCIPSAADCNDGNDCTLDACNPAVGCIFASTAGACSDGDPCTDNDFCLLGECNPGPDKCVEDAITLCSITGATNTEIDCPFRVAKAVNTTTATATALQFTMSFDSLQLEFLGFYDDICIAPGVCGDGPIIGMGAQPMSTGHTMSPAPSVVADWNISGFGGALIANLGDQTTPLSDAFLSGGSIVGDSTIFRVRFRIKSNITAGAPEPVLLGDVLTTNGASETLSLLPTWAAAGYLVTSD